MRNRFRLFFLLIFTSFNFGSLARDIDSPFPSSVAGISIHNTHLLAEGPGKILRGMLPRKLEEAKELKAYGVSDILIFRNETPGEAALKHETDLLNAAGFIDSQIHNIPFRWKEIVSFEEACKQSLAALRLLKSKRDTKGKNLYVHCTVGEDRTGYLAALYKIAFEKMPTLVAFKEHMCSHGYAEANPEKPPFVVEKIHAGLTPLFLKMAKKFEDKKLSASSLSDDECLKDPSTSNAAFQNQIVEFLKTYKCPVLSIKKIGT